MKPHPDPCQCPKCSHEMTYEPADPHYGADADGNRGMYVSAYWYCTNCEHTEDAPEPDFDDEPSSLD